MEFKTNGLTGNYSITVYNHSGQAVFRCENCNNITLDGHPKGIYYLTTTTEDKCVTKKVIKD